MSRLFLFKIKSLCAKFFLLFPMAYFLPLFFKKCRYKPVNAHFVFPSPPRQYCASVLVFPPRGLGARFYSPCHSERSRGISWKRSLLIPRGKVVRVFKFSSARVRSFCFSSNASARCFDKLNMTENKYVVVKKQLSLLFSVGATIGRPPFFEKKN